MNKLGIPPSVIPDISKSYDWGGRMSGVYQHVDPILRNSSFEISNPESRCLQEKMHENIIYKLQVETWK